jgi:adenosine kinase
VLEQVMASLPTSGVPPVVISASIAYDYIMSFGGSFADHIIPDKTHVISVSFLVDSLRKQRGGCGGNMAYNLALLGTPSTLIGAVGSDFAPYRAAMDQLGVDLSALLEVDDQATASAFMMADRKDNHIASFFPGPSELAATIDVTPIGDRAVYGVVGATGPNVMRIHAEQLGASSCRLIYDPAFQIIILSGHDLTAAIDRSWGLIANDYEYAMIERKTGLTIDDLAARVELLVVTYGEQGSELRVGGRCVRVPAAPADIVRDPTGAGDAYRSGLIKGLLLELDLEVVGRLAGLTATYVVEQIGTQEHVYTPEGFVERFDRSFPDYAGSIRADQLRAGR